MRGKKFHTQDFNIFISTNKLAKLVDLGILNFDLVNDVKKVSIFYQARVT